MKTKITFVIIALFCSIQINSQTKQEVFSRIQKLVTKTQGEKVQTNDVFSKKDDVLGKQIFTENVISVNTIPAGKSDYEWISRATEISWNHFFDYFIYTEFVNYKLQVVELNFKKNFKNEHFTTTNTADESPSSSEKFKFYVLTTDKEELVQLLTRLYDLKEKNPESTFNKEIQNFTKEQTISWLTEKLTKNIAGDSYTRGLTLVNIDACKLVFDYSNMVGRKYREIIPTDIASINKYNQFTYNDNVCISKSYAFGIIQEEDELTYNNISFLNIDTTDEDLVSNINFAMKQLAGYCNNTHATKNIETTANKTIHTKNEVKNAPLSLDNFSSEAEEAFYFEMNKKFNSFVIDNTEYTITNTTDFANFLNKNCYAALHWQGKDNYQFEEVGKTDFSKKSVEFTVKNDKLYLKANIPLNGNCDYGLKEFPVVDSDSSETREIPETKFYYFTLDFVYECNSVNYKYLTIFIEDKTLGSYDKVKALFSQYAQNN